MNKITIIRLDRPEHWGDWHDKPLKWKAAGPDAEVQKFSTRKEAELYARIRRRSADFLTASNTMDAAKSAAEIICTVACRDNPRFDRHRFLTACGLFA